MEFATEMIIKASLFRGADRRGPDHAAPGRPQGAPAAPEDVPRRLAHAAILPDVQPALAVPDPRRAAHRCSALIGYALALPGVAIGGVTFDAHTLLFASLAILCGYQSILFAIFAKTFAISEGLMPEDARMTRSSTWSTSSAASSLGAIALVVGCALLAWRRRTSGGSASFGQLDYAQTMRAVIPGPT